jgi:hypothetical protein
MFSRYDLIELTNIKAISSERRSHSKIWWFPYSRQKMEMFETVNGWYTHSPRAGTLRRLISAFIQMTKIIQASTAETTIFVKCRWPHGRLQTKAPSARETDRSYSRA